ncbi:MAG: hypothetical protein ABR597_03700, partial [Bacteroidales bacterium]
PDNDSNSPKTIAEGSLPESMISREEIQRILSEKRERLKELGAINQTTQILRQDKPINTMLQEICQVLPPAWHYPDDTVARIKYGKINVVSNSKFRETEWCQK